jgi:thymidylate synthase
MDYVNVFRDCIRHIIFNGQDVSPRGQLTKEVLSYTIKVDPLQSTFYSPIREINHSFLFAENLWYLSGRNSLFLLTHYNKNYHNFADQGILQGSYGPMILEQIRYVVNSLSKDQDSRQAVISLWRPNPNDAKDKPCTLNFHFMIRDNKLNMHVTMRSNDAIWGQNYDVPSFSHILLVIAGSLGVKPGHLYLTANSLHIYEKHFELSQKILDASYSQFQTIKFIEAPQESLERQLWYVEEVLRAHYRLIDDCDNFNFNSFDHLPSFYKQYVGAMAYHIMHKQCSPQKIGEIIAFLEKANPSLSNMYHDKYKTYLLKSQSEKPL